MTIEPGIPPSHLILCCSLFLLLSIFPSVTVLSNESLLRIRWPKYWSFSFNTSLSNEYSGLVTFRIDWFDLLAVQGTLKRLLQHHSSKASVSLVLSFLCSQLSHPYKTTGKAIALTIWTFVGKVMSLFFNKIYLIIVDLQCCVSFRGTAKWISYTYTYPLFFRFLSHIGL